MASSSTVMNMTTPCSRRRSRCMASLLGLVRVVAVHVARPYGQRDRAAAVAVGHHADLPVLDRLRDAVRERRVREHVGILAARPRDHRDTHLPELAIVFGARL